VPQENRLIIPSIGVNSVITSVGLTADGAVDVPATNVGMWAGSPAPGAHGATFLDGHSPGILSALNQVGVGQTFQVIYGGQTYTYRVAHTETIPLDSVNMRRALAVYGNGDGLNIMTCAGQFAPSRNTYDHRLIVYAVAV
jgi:sortase (surface protein transpeptidase)